MTNAVVGSETTISEGSITQLASDFNAVSFLYVLTFIPDPFLRVKGTAKSYETCPLSLLALMSANKCLVLGGLLLIASPDSACQNKHMHLIRDWFSGLGTFSILLHFTCLFLELLGFHKLSYTKERHFHGLTVGKFKDVPELSHDEIQQAALKFHVLQDKHKIEDLEE